MQDDWSRFLKRKTTRRRICWDMFIQRWLISNCRLWHIWKIRDSSEMTRFYFFFRKNVYKEGLIKDLLRTVELFHLWYLVKSEYSLRHFWDLFWNTRGAVTIFLSRRNKWVIKETLFFTNEKPLPSCYRKSVPLLHQQITHCPHIVWKGFSSCK